MSILIEACSAMHETSGNLLAQIPTSLPHELLQTLLERPGIRIERIVSRGHASPSDFWYDQHERVRAAYSGCGTVEVRGIGAGNDGG